MSDDDSGAWPRSTLAALAALVLAPALIAHAAHALSPAALVAAYGALFVPYFVALRAIGRGDLSGLDTRRVVLAIALAALASRIPLAFATPLLSDDLYRYVWDGRVAHAGINPFLHAPSSDALSHVRDAAIWPLINHPQIPTIYPPAAQLLFELNALLGGGLTLLRLLLVACEAACVGAVGWLLTRGTGAPWSRERLVLALGIYALNPLVIIETAWSGHVDALAFGTLTVALAWWTRSESARGALAAAAVLGLSASAKFLGLLVLPLLVFAPSKAPARTAWARRAIIALVTPLVLAGSYLPYVDAGPKLFSGFGTFAARWRSNDGGFRVLEAASHHALEATAEPRHRVDPDDPTSKIYVRLSGLDETFMTLGLTKEWDGKQIPNTGFAHDQASQTSAKLVGALVMAFVLLWCLLVVRDPLTSSVLLFGALFFVAPTVHPWYVAWLVPLAALRPSRAPLAFSALVVLAYSAWVSSAAGGAWVVPWWLALIEYGVVAALAVAPARSSSLTAE